VDTPYGTNNVFLVGLMGAGKTTIGRSLAKRLELAFVDTDREIEGRTGVSIPTVFDIEGEEGFRRRESEVIDMISRQNGQVIATGGGAVLRVDNRSKMRSGGIVVYLNVPPNILWERTRHDRNRPLLQVDDPLRRLEELYAIRDPIYREVANLVVDGGRMGAQNIVQTLVREIEERWKA
jgi:shikimate kinase